MDVLIKGVGSILPSTPNMDKRYTQENKSHKSEPNTFEEILKKEMRK